MNIKRKRYIRHILFVILGALAGYLLYVFIGCPTGSCAITSNPLSSIAYMSLIGWLISVSFSKGYDGCNT